MNPLSWLLDIFLCLWNLFTQPIWLFLQIFWPSSQSSDSLLEDDWRPIHWDDMKKEKKKIKEASDLKKEIRELKPSHPDVDKLRILVHGPVGAGKSSFINSVDSIFQGRITCPALAEAATDHSFTHIFKIHQIKDGHFHTYMPFDLCDIMGLEQGDLQGAHPDDLIKVLHGHIKDGHKFNPAVPLPKKHSNYNPHPSLNDKVHCLVSIIPASKISLMDYSIIQKIKLVRKKASELGVPQVVVMTYVDAACPHVKKDLKLVFKSRKIKEKMQECSTKVGVPMNCIFPVKNYHEEEELNETVNILLLRALSQILSLANDFIHNQVGPREKLDREWRRLKWEPAAIVLKLKSLQVGKGNVSKLRLLLCGPMGVGKSSFINSVSSVLQGRVTTPAQAGKGFTTRYKNYSFGTLPFVIADVMGLESAARAGVHIEDITNALKGHLKDGYPFNPLSPLFGGCSHYNSSPRLADQAHCLLMVVSAEHLSSMDQGLITKMNTVRERAHDLPVAVIMTMVDRFSPRVKENLQEIYTIKSIKDKMEEFSELLKVPLTSIFPVKNYCEETELDDKMDALITHVLSHILTLANDHVSSKAE